MAEYVVYLYKDHRKMRPCWNLVVMFGLKQPGAEVLNDISNSHTLP